MTWGDQVGDDERSPVESGMTRSSWLSRDDKEAALRFGRNRTI